MQNKRILAILAVFQILIIGGMLFKAMLPLFIGEEIKVEVQGRDPRALFRGNYVALDYAFSEINLDSLSNNIFPDRKYHFGDVLYLEMESSGDVYHATGLWQLPPDNGTIYLKGIVQYHYGNRMRMRYGIGSFFTDPQQAKNYEKKLLKNRFNKVKKGKRATVTLMVAPYGEARIKQINFPAL